MLTIIGVGYTKHTKQLNILVCNHSPPCLLFVYTVCRRQPTINNSLPENVISALSLTIFRQRLKHFCSRLSSLTLLTQLLTYFLFTVSGP